MPFWLLMILLPKAAFTRKIMSSNLIFVLLGSLYTGLLTSTLTLSQDGSGSEGAKELLNPSLDGIIKLLGNRQSAFAGWVHFLAFDLFVGRWIYLDSLERGKPARLSILLTLFAGPLGLLFYLTLVRPRLKKPAPVENQEGAK